MMQESMLYPVNNAVRQSMLLDGLWNFRFDPKDEGQTQNWSAGLPAPISMPVPASFADLFTTKAERDYCGTFWYERELFVPKEWQGDTVKVRFGSVTHRATVYLNGVQVAEHEGGFLPFAADITEAVRFGGRNLLTVCVNNELSEAALPCGMTTTRPDGTKVARGYFDFFNYSGIHRSVWLLRVPKESIKDYALTYEIGLNGGADAAVHYHVETESAYQVRVSLRDEDGKEVACAEGADGTMTVPNAHLWQVRNAYLYTFTAELVDGERVVDSYSDKVGIRTVSIEGERICINGKPVYLKGFGKHEDFELLGRGFHWGIVKRDFECMKWSNANCFRTSHYPYAEEWYQFADREGFLIIDEVPAVGMLPSLMNFADAGSGKHLSFFDRPDVPALKQVHLKQVEEMIARDKNHPSVFAWSLFNEPETSSKFARAYFTDVFAAAKELDPQKRPRTGALVKESSPQTCQCYSLCDFICLNRYYGWYINGGVDLDSAVAAFQEEMDGWAALKLGVPFVFTEFGADTHPTEHKLPSVMWTQEYQCEYMEQNFEVFDRYDFIQGELVWNFADFQAGEGILRVNGNKKGVFTRTRQPKDVAFMLRKRWGER